MFYLLKVWEQVKVYCTCSTKPYYLNMIVFGCVQAQAKESGQRTAFNNFSALKRSPIYLMDFVNFIISNGHNPAAVVCVKFLFLCISLYPGYNLM